MAGEDGWVDHFMMKTWQPAADWGLLICVPEVLVQLERALVQTLGEN